MKKRSLILLLLAVLAFSLLSIAASADGPDSYTVTFDKCAPGSEVALFILTPGSTSVKADNILFIDQLSADETGTISVCFIAPSFTEGEIFLGGVFSDGAVSPRWIDFFPPSPVGSKILRMPAMLSAIDKEAFADGTFTHVYLGENVQSIGPGAFADCKQLVYIYIPSSVTDIAADAFSGSDSVVIGCKSGSYAQQYALDKGIPFSLKD